MKDNKKKIMWKPEEDMLLKTYIQIHGEGHWSAVSKKLGLGRGGKSCRLRWKNYLRPDIKHGSMSEDEEDIIIRMHKLIGNRWALIAGRLPGRTDNEVKNYWNTYLSKKVKKSRAKIKPLIRDKLIDNNHGSTQEEASTNAVNMADVAKKDNAAGGSKEHDDDDKYWFSSDDIDFSGDIVVGTESGAGNLSLGIMDMHSMMDQYDDQFRGFWDGENSGLIDTVGTSEWIVDVPLCTAYPP